MLKSPILFAAAFMSAALVLAPQSIAQTKNPNVHKPGTPSIVNFKANTRQTKLKCTGGAGHMTCTSKVAWVVGCAGSPIRNPLIEVTARKERSSAWPCYCGHAGKLDR